MREDTVLLDAMDGVVHLQINRPQALNALNQEVLRQLGDFFDQLDDYDDVRGVIISGTGDRAFVAGADIKEFSFDDEAVEAKSRYVHGIFRRIEEATIPVIAAIDGFALGGGCELAMACHLRIATTRSRFGQPEINLGIIPGYGGTQRLPQLVGRARAIEMLITGDMIDAETALSWGLVNHVVEPGAEVEAARAILQKVVAMDATARILKLVQRHYTDPGTGMDREIEAFGQIFLTADAREGVTAFLEKRPPQFGRSAAD